MRAFLAAALILVAWPAGAVDVLTSRNDLARTGVNAAEQKLTRATVSAERFGKLWTLYADGQVVAQPLYVSNLAIDTAANPNTPPVQGTFNAVVIATMHNTVYVYDADRERPGPQGQNVPLWATWLGQPRPGGKDVDMWSTNDPEWGILGTPVIDAAKSTLYAVAWHDEGGGNFRYRLHALRLRDGTHVRPAVALDGPDVNHRHQKQRAGLLLDGGTLYIALGGDGNRGVLLAYDAATLARKASWTVTPSGNNGGLWQAGVAPAADADGNVYVMTGNGTFNAHQPGGTNYGDSFVKLRLESGALVVKDYFTPCNERFLNSIDHDLGSSGPVLLPGKLIVGGGKEGRLYVLSTDNLGKHVPAPQPEAPTCPNPNALQDMKGTLGHIHGAPVFWQGGDGARLYVWGENDRLRAYRFVNRRIVNDPRLAPFRPPDGMPGGMLSLSSNGGGNGILWAVVPLDGDANTQRGVKGMVLALDAQDVTRVLWTSEQAGPRDRLGLFAKYVPPTIADGKVFVATYGDDEVKRTYGGPERPQQFPARYQVVVYGLLPGPPPPVVNQTRDDVQLVRAVVEGPVAIDASRCRALGAGTMDCTEELARVAGAPSLEAVTAPVGSAFAGCQLLRVTTASRSAALPAALGVGFYAADTTGGQFSNNHGRRVGAGDLKRVGDATLKSGQPAVLHEFAALVNCQLGPGTTAGKQFKPYMDFLGGTPATLFRNWDPVAGNYAVAGATGINRAGEVLQ